MEEVTAGGNLRERTYMAALKRTCMPPMSIIFLSVCKSQNALRIIGLEKSVEEILAETFSFQENDGD